MLKRGSIWDFAIKVSRLMPFKLRHRLGSLFLSRLPARFFDFGFSGNLVIEPTNACNLSCPFCPTGLGLERPAGMMSLEHFKRIVDELGGSAKGITLYGSGEPLLNRHVFRMARYAVDRGISTTISTNATLLPKEGLGELFEAGLDNLIVCLDGATAKTHEAYRVGSKFEQVVANIRSICREKKRLKASKPNIILQFLVMKQNEHEIDAVIDLAKQLGVDDLALKTVSLGSYLDVQGRIARAEEFLPSQDKYRRYEWDGGVPKIKTDNKPLVCPWIRQSVVHYNGDVTLCCYDFEGKMKVGNIFRDGGFGKIWRSLAYRKARKKVVRGEFDLCKGCTITREASSWVKINGVQ